MSVKAEADFGPLIKSTNRLNSDLKNQSNAGARRQADFVAGRIAAGTPVRTGALRATVRTVPVERGWGVTYGGGLPYAWYIEKRNRPVRNGIDGSDIMFLRDMEQLATKLAART